MQRHLCRRASPFAGDEHAFQKMVHPLRKVTRHHELLRRRPRFPVHRNRQGTNGKKGIRKLKTMDERKRFHFALLVGMPNVGQRRGKRAFRILEVNVNCSSKLRTAGFFRKMSSVSPIMTC